MAIIEFWGGKLDGTVIDTSKKQNQDWYLFMLMESFIESKDLVGVLYYFGEHYVIKDRDDEKVAIYLHDGELYDMLEQIKNNDFPEDEAYFF